MNGWMDGRMDSEVQAYVIACMRLDVQLHGMGFAATMAIGSSAYPFGTVLAQIISHIDATREDHGKHF